MAGILNFLGLASYARRLTLAKKSWRSIIASFALIAAVLPSQLNAAPITIDFESLADSDAVTSQYAALSFSNATALTAGITLNEFEFPPRSGANVVLDDGGAISITFASLAQSFGAYFTYGSAVTLRAFDGAANLLTSVTSDFSSNSAISGDAGSAPNEFLNIAIDGIKRIVIEGDRDGGSFVMDDVIYEQANNGGGTAPEPGTTLLFLAAFIAAALTKKRAPIVAPRCFSASTI